jgi:Domain of unknown function (DUF6379)
MFEQYVICEQGFRNVSEKGQVTGFQLRLRIANWRGLPLSLIEDVRVNVDGVAFPRDAIKVSVGGGSFTLDEMIPRSDVRWQFDEIATVTIRKPGGLAPGMHDIAVVEQIRTGLAALPTSERPTGMVALAGSPNVATKKMTLVA